MNAWNSIFLALLFVWMSSWMNAWDSILHFCFNENAWDSVFHFRMKMRFYLSFFNACNNASDSTCKNAWDLFLVFFYCWHLEYQRMFMLKMVHESMRSTLFISPFLLFFLILFLSLFLILMLTFGVNSSLFHHWIHLKFVLENDGCCKSWSYC